jgi:alpha-glucosidase
MNRQFSAPRNAIYQIFVDRFAGPRGEALSLATHEAPWRTHAGGHLEGVAQRLDHITNLGCDALYLTPIFEAPSNHKYDVADYYKVDERFGGDAAFEALAQQCRERGLGLILDGVFNHVGTHHAWFQRAREDANNEEASFFLWINHPDDYECWQSHHMLPELNLDHQVVRETLITGQESVVRHWLRRGATGWRLDCANDIGPTLCSIIADVVDEEQAYDGAIGEVMAYAEDFVQPDGLHGVMNYYFRATILALLRGETTVAQAAANLKRMAKRYYYPALLHSWNILATHDTPRLATLLPSLEQRRLAYTLAFTYPGVPLIYYGEEVGMNGGPDPANRAPMQWETTQWEEATLQTIRTLAQLRRTTRCLREGGFISLPQPAFPSVLAFARTGEHPSETVIVLANVAEHAVEGRFFVPLSWMFDSLPLHDLLCTERTTKMESGTLKTKLGAYDVALLMPAETKRPRYSFFSGYQNNMLACENK